MSRRLLNLALAGLLAFALSASACAPARAQVSPARVAAMAGAHKLTRHIRILFAPGDSTPAGVGAGSGGTTDVNGARPNSIPLQLARVLLAMGYPVATDTVNVDNNNGIDNTSWNGYRPEITVGSGCTQASGAGTGLASASQSPTIGGVQPLMSSALQGFCYTASGDADTIEYWINQVGSTQTQVTRIGSTTVDSYLQTTGCTSCVKNRVIAGQTIHNGDVVSIQRSGGNIYLPYVIDIYKAGQPAFHVFNAGWRNSTITDWSATTTANSPQAAIANMGSFFDVLVVDDSINHQRLAAGAGGSVATEKTAIEAYVNAFLAGNPNGKIVFLVPNPISQGDIASHPSASIWSNPDNTQLYTDLKADYPSNSAFVDTAALAAVLAGTNPATYATLNSAGYMHDTLHPDAGVGGDHGIYGLMGTATANAILKLLGLSLLAPPLYRRRAANDNAKGSRRAAA